jgi:3-oxoacyl-[acyl-carrier protein] reductase
MELDGRVALITGANGEIGKGVAELFARQGAKLCLADMGDAPAFAGEAGRTHYVRVDVRDPASVAAMVDAAVAAFGRLDLLVNIAGVVSFGSADGLTVEEWDHVIGINLRATFLSCQAAMRAMRKNGYGRIVNIGSIVGKNGGNARPWLDRGEQAKAGTVAYGVSKAGVHAMTVFLAKEGAADGITVNCVAPGPVASSMTTAFPEQLRALIPVGRMGQAADVARACLFLAGEGAGFVTGETLDVNGGMWGD